MWNKMKTITAPWIRCLEQLPPENKVVNTKIHDADGERNIALLYRQGRLWYFPDHSMYVYYTPTHWHEIETAEANEI